MRQVYDKATGKFRWVNDNGAPISGPNDPMGVNPGMGSLPNQALLREIDLASRLPDAQLAGYRGRSVVDPKPMRGARPEDPEPRPVPTYRPLAGSKQNNRGQSKVLQLPPNIALETVDAGSIVETSRNSGDDAENITIVCGKQILGDPSTSTAVVQVHGTIEFGIGGAFFEADFDWGTGTSFSLPASFIRVKASVDFLNPGLVPVPLSLTAALGYGGKGASLSSHMKKTFRPAAPLAPGGTFSGRIPSFATGVTVAHSALTARGTLSLFGSGVGGADYDIASMSNTANQRDGLLPIPSGFEQFTYTNTGLVNCTPHILFNIVL